LLHQKYEDKEEILRKTQFLAGSNIYIAEDFSKKVRDKRTELRKFMKQTKKRQPLAKMSLRYDKLIMGKEVYTYNEVTGLVELTVSGLSGEDGGRHSPTSQPTTPHHARAKSRSKSSGRRKKLEKAFSTESALNYIGDDLSYSREPSPTKSPLLELKDEALLEDKLRPESTEQPEAEETSQSLVNGNRSSDELDVEESQIAANYAAITAYNGPIRKFSAEIPETITEDE